MSKNKQFGIKRFMAIADSYVNSKNATLEDIEKTMIFWACDKLNTVPWDERIQKATLEDLLTFYYMHRLREEPHLREQLYAYGDERDEYEKWVKEQFGEEYMTVDEQVRFVEELERKEREKAQELPDKITTDFTKVDKKDE